MRQTLRLLTSVSLVATAFLSADAQNVGIRRDGLVPNAKAILDLDVSATSGNPFQGMLIPRMSAAQRQAINSLTAADQGLWVYQTDDATNTSGDPTLDGAFAKGYWYYEGVNLAAPFFGWVRWSTSNGSWRTTGNANTVATTHYLGTPTGSNDDLYIRTTNSLAPNPSMRINATDGFVGVNLAAAPVERMEVAGGVQVGNTAANNVGSIKHDNTAVSPNRWHYGNVDGTATGWKRMENAETRYINQSYCPIVQQCGSTDGTLVKGIYDGSPVASVAVTGPMHTPFMTNTGAFNRQGYRVQYIYPGSELLAAGLCPGFITKFSFYVLTSENPCTPNVNCPDVKIDIRMGNTALASFGAVVNSSAAPTAVAWDAPTEAAPQIYATSTLAELVTSGWKDFQLGGYISCTTVAASTTVTTASTTGLTVGSIINGPGITPNSTIATIVNGTTFTITPAATGSGTNVMGCGSGLGFNWTGGNLIIDLSWQRATTLGSSPSVQLEEALAYGASKWVQVTANFSPAHGNTYQDNPLTANATCGVTNTRPVTRFYGKVASPAYGAVTTAAFLNYGGGLMIDHNANPTTWADGAYMGPGTIRASLGVYDGNTALSDHVFDKYYGGEVAPEDVKSAEGYTYVGLPGLKDYLEKERHLPNMPSREEWELHGSPSLGTLQTGLWESVETQALYITQLEQDLSALESLAFGKLKNADEINRLIGDVKNSRRLTEAQKLHLTNALQARLNAHTDNK